MAHLAALCYTSEDVLSDSKSAPDGSDSCDHVSENSFESIRTDNEMTNKISVVPAVNHSDISNLADDCRGLHMNLFFRAYFLSFCLPFLGNLPSIKTNVSCFFGAEGGNLQRRRAQRRKEKILKGRERDGEN